MRRILLLSLFWVVVGPASAGAAPGLKVTKDGQVSLAGRALGQVPLPPGPIKIELKERDVAGRGMVHIVISGGGRTAEVLAEAASGGRTLFAGATGPRGVDGEWSRHLRVDGKGVLLYQTRVGASRCDGTPIFLFPRGYDFNAGRFRPVSARVPVGPLPVIRATRTLKGAPLMEPMSTFKVTFASSQLGDGGSAENLSPPVELNDRAPDTAWAEGLGGDGRGEVIIARAQHARYRLYAIGVVPGDAASPAAFRKANRLRSIVLVLSPEHKYRVLWDRDPAADVGKEKEPFWIQLPKPVPTRCVSLVLDQVYPGTLARGGSGGRTAISELTHYSELSFGAGVERLLADLSSDDQGRQQAAVAALAGMGPRGVALVTGPTKDAAKPHAEQVARVLMASEAPGALAHLARMLPDLSRPTRRLALDALERGDSRTISALLKLLRDTPLDQDQLVDVTLLLGKVGGIHARDALISLAGVGDEARRAAMVNGLVKLRGPGDASAVLRGAEQAGTDLARADLVLAVGRMPGALAQGEDLARRAAALWRDDAPFELRFRIINSAGRLDPVGQNKLIFKSARCGDPALRAAAVDTLRRNTSSQATAALVTALQDADPRVRTSAALSLGRRRLSQAQRDALVGTIKTERWGMVAGQLAEALGAHCGGAAVAALREVTRHGPRGYAVDRRALESMSRCQPRGMGKFLLATAGDGRWRTGMRIRALSLITPALGKPMAGELVALFERLRRGAMRSEADEQVAVAAAGTLGSVGGAHAADALAGALALEPLPTVRLASALALGRACHLGTRATLVQASRDAPSRVMQAAKNSLARCGWGIKKSK